MTVVWPERAEAARNQGFEQGSLRNSPYLVGGLWKLPAIIECGLVGRGLNACPVGPGERTKLSSLRARLLEVEREEMAGPSLRIFQGREDMVREHR